MSSLAGVIPADSREHEIKLLVDLVRLSRVTVLYAEAGAGKSSVIRDSVVPLLQRAHGRQTEVPLLLETWTLPALRSRIDAAIASVTGRPVEGDESRDSASLVELLTRYQETLDVTFILIFDRFEEYLSAPLDPGLLQFEEQFVEVVTDRTLRTHVLLSLDEAAAPLLGRLQSQIPGLGDARVRLPRPSPAAPSAEQRASTIPLFAGSAPSQEQGNRGESLAESLERVRAQFKPHEALASAPLPGADGNFDAGATPFEALRGSEPPSRIEPVLAAVTQNVSPEAPVSIPEDKSTDLSVQRLPSSGRTSDPERVRRRTRRAWFAVALATIMLSYWLFVTPRSGLEPAVKAPATVPEAPAPQPAPAETTATAQSGNAYGLTWDETPLKSETDYSTPRDWLGIDTRDTPSPSAATASVPRSDRADAAPTQRATVTPAPAAKSAPSAATSPPRSAEAPSGPLLFIHVRDEAQRARAQRMIGPLAKRGIRVSGIRLVSMGPSVTDLRYFRPSERDEAVRVARALREVGVETRRLHHIPGLEPQAVRRQYELWLPEGRRDSGK